MHIKIILKLAFMLMIISKLIISYSEDRKIKRSDILFAIAMVILSNLAVTYLVRE